MAEAAASANACVILMHMRGTDPATMQSDLVYADLIGEVREFLADCAAAAVRSGIAPRRIALDPGLGFSKSAAQSAALLREVQSIRSLGYPVVIGASRKNFARTLSGAPEEGSSATRLPGSLACAGFAARQGAAIVRVHDVAETVAYLKMSRAIENVTMGR